MSRKWTYSIQEFGRHSCSTRR